MKVKAYGPNIKRLREGLKISQEDLAERADIATRVLQRIESGKANTKIGTLEKVAAALSVPLVELFNLESGGRMPAKMLQAKGAKAGYKQLSDSKRAKMDAQAAGASKTAKPLEVVPPDLSGVSALLSTLEGLPDLRKKIVLALIFDNTAFARGVPTPLFRTLEALLKADQDNQEP